MTLTTTTLTTSVVTPHKVHRDRKVRARLLHRALGVAPFQCNDEEPCEKPRIKLVASPSPHPQQGISSNTKARVFRCLSNSNSLSTHNAPSNSITPDVSSRRSASLKYTFRPPADVGLRLRQQHEHRQQGEQQDRSPPRAVHFHGLIDKSSLYQRPICFLSRKQRYALALAHHRQQLQQQQRKEAQKQRQPEGQENEQPPQAAAVHHETQNEDAENQTRTKKVVFKPIISVISIPSHRDYPEPMKRSMWGSLKEIKTNAIRNTAEYMHDKCSWRQATEEDQMYLDTRTGNLVHPVHVQRLYAAWLANQEKQKQMLQLKRKRSHEEEEEVDDLPEDEEEVDEEMPTFEPQIEHHDHSLHRSCRKPIHPCSPSPIRRRIQQPIRTPSPGSPEDCRPQHKRLRIHCAPMPSSPNLYSHRQQMQYMQQHHMLQQQENLPHSNYHQQHHSICNSRIGPVAAGPCSYPY